MSFTPDFTVEQSASSPNLVDVVDTATGSDAAITQRRVYVQNAVGDYLVPSGTTTDYTQWDIAETDISLDILTQDEAVNVLVQWLNVSNTVLYTKNTNYCLAEYNKQFLYYLVGLQGLTPGIYQDTNYSGNIAIFWTNVIAAINAVEFGNDIAASQDCLRRATQMRLNESYYF